MKIAIEIVDFPINSMVDLSIAMLVYQRVYIMENMLEAPFLKIHQRPKLGSDAGDEASFGSTIPRVLE